MIAAHKSGLFSRGPFVNDRPAMNACQDVSMLAAAEWRGLAAAHYQRARIHTGPARERRDRGLPHPIADFLFEYYPYSFAFLEQWHPGIGTGIEWSAADAEDPSLHHLSDRWYRHEKGVLMPDPA